MDRASILDMIQSRITTVYSFNYDNLIGPPLSALLYQRDVDDLHHIVTSIKYSGNIRKRYKLVDDILKPKGFVIAGAGTNRRCYRYLNDDSFVLKIATDAVGIKDNPREFKNQMFYKPFCTKTFEVDRTGTIGIAERDDPFTNREEFESAANDIYYLITNFIIGKYIAADIGSHYFMNWGLRRNFGPVLHDYTYLYELDPNKLICMEPDKFDSSKPCGGEIDYDPGFNKLYCTKCGKWYRVQQLAKLHHLRDICEMKEGDLMDVVINRGNGVTIHCNTEKSVGLNNSTPKIEKKKTTEYATEIIVKPVNKIEKKQDTRTESRNRKPMVNDSKINTTNNSGIVTETRSESEGFKVITTKPVKTDKPVDNSIVTDTVEEPSFKVKVNTDTTTYGYFKDKSKEDLETAIIDAVNNSTTNADLNKEAEKEPVDVNKVEETPVIKRGVVPVEQKESTVASDIPQPKGGKKSKHFKKISYNEKFKTITLNGETGADRYVIELGQHPEIIQQIVDGSDYMKNVLDMKSKSMEALQKNNSDLNKEIENLRTESAELKKQHEELIDRLKVLQNQLLEKNTFTDVVDEVKPNIPIPVPGKEEEEFNPEDINTSVLMNGYVSSLMALGLVKDEKDDHKVIIFPDDGEGNYVCDTEGHLICMVMINDVMIDKYDQIQQVISYTEDEDDTDTDGAVSDN